MDETFRASVQYNDFKGTAAADRADNGGPELFLRKKGLAGDNDFIVGIELWAGENPGVHEDPVTVHFLLLKGGFDDVQRDLQEASAPVTVRRVSIDVPLVEFVGLFKRFNLTMSPEGMLDGRSYSINK